MSEVRATGVGVTTAVASGSEAELSEFAEFSSATDVEHETTAIIKVIATNVIFSKFERRGSVKVVVVSASNRPNSVLPAYQATTHIAGGYWMTQRQETLR